jgi:RHH-type proline utilization regulon transcriptional repressor/proline dehydrogenase/delta 1-pyrroline-5-carboxylate dehydrogenase
MSPNLESAIRDVGHEIAGAFPRATRHPLRRLEDRALAQIAADRELRAAMFRFVDVAPACRSPDDLARHLLDHLGRLERPPAPARAGLRLSRSKSFRRTLGVVAAVGVRQMARRFIVGRTPKDALPLLERSWKSGVASTLDLLGEDTLTRADAERYAARCEGALRALSAGGALWPERPQLAEDSTGALPRANLSLKVTALAPLLRPHAPEVGRRDAAPRLRSLLRLARDLDAHVHVDMESLDTRETTLELALDLLAESEFEGGPSAGVVLQAYLRDSHDELEEILRWAQACHRGPPLVVRLVKGAYWDHEVAEARQHGWEPPVYTRKDECDANFERLTRRLLEARPLIRVAIGSHNLRSVSHAIALGRALGTPDRDLELQVLRGLGDDLQQALAKLGFRVRTYCPVGELVEGMAYLVRRLLENTSNESFVHRHTVGDPLDALLAAPAAETGEPAGTPVATETA